MQLTHFINLCLATTTLASPLLRSRVMLASSDLESRAQTCAATCGTVCYYAATVNTAVTNGCALTNSGDEEGSSDYPHQYNDYEGFNFPVTGPYYEYPIDNDFKPYSGGSPGADRVVYNKQCQLGGVITHTGASGDDFVGCTGTDGSSTK